MGLYVQAACAGIIFRVRRESIPDLRRWRKGQCDLYRQQRSSIRRLLSEHRRRGDPKTIASPFRRGIQV
jgi:hypothetical protein